ncbi:MAG TPA: cellulase-like family protein [Candidatus Sulfotelmatobacter sp.]
MGEFSWIERRWPGHKDWDRALDELRERGYDAVRIDPFPHLLAADPQQTWTLWPQWNTQMWGSPDVNRIVLLPALFDFFGKCRDRGIMVGLSTRYRRMTPTRA